MQTLQRSIRKNGEIYIFSDGNKGNSIWNQSYMKELDIVASDENLKLPKLKGLLHIGRSLYYFIRYTQNIQQENKHGNSNDQSPYPKEVL